MKKFIITFSIIAVVVVAHVFLLRSFIFQDKKKTEEIPKNPVENPVDKDKIPPPEDTSKKKSWLPYIYKNAVIGEVPGLDDSKKVKAGILVDLDSRNVLWAKNPRKAVAIASMTKMMTELIVFEEMDKRKDITLETEIKVTATASKVGGSQIYLDSRESFPLEDLLKSVMIASANDAAQLVAEYFGDGDAYQFVNKMNERAKELKIGGAMFFNPHGLPGANASEDNTCSCEGLVKIAEHLQEYPKAIEWAATKTDQIRKNTAKPFNLSNHNHLLGVCPGVNGMKTGFIQRSGFCITVTCERGKRKLACAVTGFSTRKERDIFVAKLLDWGYRQKPKAAENPELKSSDPKEENNLEELLGEITPK